MLTSRFFYIHYSLKTANVHYSQYSDNNQMTNHEVSYNRDKHKFLRIRTTPQEDNSPPYRFWSWWVVLFRGSGPSGELSWWGIVLGILVLVGNGWALFLSGGELSSWGVVLEPNFLPPIGFSVSQGVSSVTSPSYTSFPSFILSPAMEKENNSLIQYGILHHI